MPHRNLATWNAYISFAVQDQRSEDAIASFKEFLCARFLNACCVHGEPNSITFCAFLNACVDLLRLNLVRQLHLFIVHCGL